MTKEEAAKWAEIYKAYAEGEEIQSRSGDGWVSIEDPFFNCPVSFYRVKPEVKKSVGYKRYLCRYGDKVYVHTFVQREDEDVDVSVYGANFIKFIDAEWQYEEFTEDDL